MEVMILKLEIEENGQTVAQCLDIIYISLGHRSQSDAGRSIQTKSQCQLIIHIYIYIYI